MDSVSFGNFIIFWLCSCACAASQQQKYLTASPDTIVEGLTSDLTLRCSVSEVPPSVNSVLLIQLEKDNNGSHVSIATMHAGEAAVLDSSELKGRGSVSGHVDRANMSSSFLQVDIHSPHALEDQGRYICVIMALEHTGLLIQIREELVVNSTTKRSIEDTQRALDLLIREVAQLKSRVSGNCKCGENGSDVSQLKEQLHHLQETSRTQSQEILQLRHKVTSLEMRPPGGVVINGSIGLPSVTPMKPLGFVAVGAAGSVQYTTTIYNTNGSFDLQHDQFKAPAAGFYFFHAYDSQPTVPLLSLYLNGHPLANSAKAVPMGPVKEGETPVYSHLSVSGLVHLNQGDVVSVKYVSNTQSMGASFSGALVSANDG